MVPSATDDGLERQWAAPYTDAGGQRWSVRRDPSAVADRATPERSDVCLSRQPLAPRVHCTTPRRS